MRVVALSWELDVETQVEVVDEVGDASKLYDERVKYR